MILNTCMGLCPDFKIEYSGNSSDVVFSGDPRGNWVMTFKKSGTLTVKSLGSAKKNGIDIFLVGGGANGGAAGNYSDGTWGTGENYYGGYGGGSGYTTTVKAMPLTVGTYTITVGNAGEATSAFGHSANGSNSQSGKRSGGAGCGGGYWAGSDGWGTESAGSGADGEYAFGESSFAHALGAGYKFAASGGGGAGCSPALNYGNGIYGNPASGGKDGAGNGASHGDNGGNAAANSGSGGGGAGGYSGTGGAGGSGIVIIRNARG